MSEERSQTGLSARRHPGDSENVLTVAHKLRSHKLQAPLGEEEALLNIVPFISYISGCQAVTLEA